LLQRFQRFRSHFDVKFRYPPGEEIGERGNIAAGVDHFHDASSRITDRSADNSSVTNRCRPMPLISSTSISSLATLQFVGFHIGIGSKKPCNGRCIFF
jgi:hypothetical protein